MWVLTVVCGKNVTTTTIYPESNTFRDAIEAAYRFVNGQWGYGWQMSEGQQIINDRIVTFTSKAVVATLIRIDT